MDTSTAGIAIAIMLGLIGLLFTVSVKLVLGRIDALSATATIFHRDAMGRLDALTVAIVAVGTRIDEHVRDHAAGIFK
ncbi:MAG TPA: hypothetical protein VGV13_00965 [Methylomirabilota bacterium]|jgi:hypothetical protein|nr:hypothetical protein [Methylomirabilota bacterium]